MARWRLRAKHYINVPGTEYEYRETDQASGKQARKVFPVPMYLDPDNPGDCNYPGEIIVCQEGRGQPRDLVFFGDPTPDMEPLDDEAREISASLAPVWQHPIDSLPAEGFTGIIMRQLENTPVQSSPSKSDFDELKAKVDALLARNAELEAEAAKPRRV